MTGRRSPRGKRKESTRKITMKSQKPLSPTQSTTVQISQSHSNSIHIASRATIASYSAVAASDSEDPLVSEKISTLYEDIVHRVEQRQHDSDYSDYFDDEDDREGEEQFQEMITSGFKQLSKFQHLKTLVDQTAERSHALTTVTAYRK